MNKITQSQIQDLYKFTRQHYVEHYDVQTELVDHLANDIEQIWTEEPNLTYENAKQKSFKKFGVFGFMNVVEARQKAMSKRYTKMLFKYAKEWFRLPKILMTTCLFLICYFLVQIPIGKNFFLGFIFFLVIVEFYLIFKLRKRSKKRFKENGKKWMLEDMIFNIANINAILFGANLFNFFRYTSIMEFSPFGASIFSIVFVFIVIYSYVSLRVLPEKAEELLQETYPEYKIV